MYGMWIMGFENSGAWAKPIEFKEMLIMIDLPKAFFNKKLVIIVRKNDLNFLENSKNPKGFLKLG